MIKQTSKNQKGFTVIEMLVSCAVAGSLLIIIMTFLTNTLVNSSVDSARSDLLREAQLTLDSIGREIRLSASVDEQNRWEDSNSPDAVSTNGYGWEADADTLILATSAEDADDNILFSDATHYITYKNNVIYYLDGTSLYRRTIAGPVSGNDTTTTCPEPVASETCPADRELIRNVSGFELRYLDSLDQEVPPAQARSVEISLSLETERYGREVNAEYVTRTVFRNE